MNRFFLIRHGETEQNKQNIIQGRMDNPLNETGKSQAFHVASWFQHHAISLDWIVSSPLIRAKETATIVKDSLAMSQPLQFHNGLIERNFGFYDGKPIQADYFDHVIQETIPGMEKHQELEERVLQAIDEIALKHPHQTIALVCHSHVIKALFVRIKPHFTYRSYLKNGSIHECLYDPLTKQFDIIQFNIDPTQ